MKIVVIDGQGGKMGRGVIEQLVKLNVQADIWAIGTNSIATTTMLKAGAKCGATGENPVLVSIRNADVIVGPIGIVIADSLMGEITPAMAVAIGQSQAEKILLPVNKCNHFVVGVQEQNVTAIICAAANRILEKCNAK